MNVLLKNLSIAFLCTFCISAAHADSGKILVTVNGTKITTRQLDQWVSMAVSGGAKNSPELRQTILNDLVVRAAIVQDVKKTNLLSKGNNAFKVKLAEENTISDLWFGQYLASHPVTDADIRAAYDKQVELSHDPKNAEEYLVSQIAVANETDGIDLIKQINAGASFQELAKAKSLDKTSGDQGGVIGWFLSSQLAPPVNSVVPNLAKGKVSQTPIKTDNAWYVVKVGDIRPFTLPGFEQAKNAIAQSLAQQRRQEAVNALMQNVKVAKGN
jgi:peptidyl-prolyl cis-trans isomerase C